ncbi:MAG: GPW/gp25 family protein, partial [Spirochaetia bacterium]
YARYIAQLVRQVLLTNPGERINRPDFGCGIKQMVFMPLNEATAGVTQVMIFQALEKWLGSVIAVDQVRVSAENSSLIIDIAYTVRFLGQRIFLNMEVPV